MLKKIQSTFEPQSAVLSAQKGRLEIRAKRVWAEKARRLVPEAFDPTENLQGIQVWLVALRDADGVLWQDAIGNADELEAVFRRIQPDARKWRLV